MDYRMINISATKEDNVVDLISKKLNEQGWKNSNLKLHFVGFEAPAGTKFYLNNQKDPIKVPRSGNFISPYDGERYMNIFNLKFESGFTGDIYYII